MGTAQLQGTRTEYVRVGQGSPCIFLIKKNSHIEAVQDRHHMMRHDLHCSTE